MRYLPDGINVNRKQLHQLLKRPKPFEDEERVFWANPYISRHVLDAHLDEAIDAATRPPEERVRELDWMLQQARREHRFPAHVLDLGCGPGLYAEALLEQGCSVTGVDVAPAAVEHARSHCTPLAESLGLSAAFIHGDYVAAGEALWDELEDGYDMVLLVYGGMATISDRRRDRLFERTFQALRPGGLFIFDVMTQSYVEQNRLRPNWHMVSRDGFWSPRPHLLLEQSYHYPKHRVSADRYVILHFDGTADAYTVWHRYHGPNEIRSAARAAGFRVVRHTADLSGTPYYRGSPWIGILAQKPHE